MYCVLHDYDGYLVLSFGEKAENINREYTRSGSGRNGDSTKIPSV